MKKIRLGMIGGGKGAFIGVAHRIAAHMDDMYQLVGGVLDVDYKRGLAFAKEIELDTSRVYATVEDFVKKENALPENERIEAVSICTPNFLHYTMAKKLIQGGFHVICEKPMTTDSKQALELEGLVKKHKVIFCLTHNYTGYPMVREMRKLIEQGKIGKIQRVHGQYYQGWINPIIHDPKKRKQIWRLDPKVAGISCCMGDIGVHTFNLLEYITQMEVTSVLADLNTLYVDNPLDVDGTVLLRLGKGVKGVLAATQIATGEENSIQIKVYGSKGGFRWDQENPTYLYFLQEGKSAQVLKPGNPYNTKFSLASTRIVSGHPEAFFEAFGNLYRGAAKAIRGKKIDAGEFPTVHDGLRGITFIESVVKSNKTGNKWVTL